MLSERNQPQNNKYFIITFIKKCRIGKSTEPESRSVVSQCLSGGYGMKMIARENEIIFEVIKIDCFDGCTYL